MYWLKCIAGCVVLMVTLGFFGLFTDYSPLSFSLRSAPCIEVDSTELHLGWVDKKEDEMAIEFEVHNSGGQELVLCPDAETQDIECFGGIEDLVVPPGETRSLALVFDRTLVGSYFRIELPYHANDARVPEVVFVVTGNQITYPKKKSSGRGSPNSCVAID